MLNPNNPLNRPIAVSNLFWTILVLLLLVGNIFFSYKYFSSQKDLRQSEDIIAASRTNEQVLNFTKLFLAKVLRAEGEIDFETRLSLENAVRNLQDEDILNQWNRFVESQNETQAQVEVKNLLELLVDKIK